MASAAAPLSWSGGSPDGRFAGGPLGVATPNKLECCSRILFKIAASCSGLVVGLIAAATSFGANPVCHAFGSPVRSRTCLTAASSSSYADISAATRPCPATVPRPVSTDNSLSCPTVNKNRANRRRHRTVPEGSPAHPYSNVRVRAHPPRPTRSHVAWQSETSETRAPPEVYRRLGRLGGGWQGRSARRWHPAPGRPPWRRRARRQAPLPRPGRAPAPPR